MYDPIPLRTVILRPFGKEGPSYTLRTWDSGKRDWRGQTKIGYLFTRRAKVGRKTIVTPLFGGDDFTGSPMHADDSDETMKALLIFLTLKPGDTDREYFKDYTPEQMDFAQGEAEAVMMEVYNRFGMD